MTHPLTNLVRCPRCRNARCSVDPSADSLFGCPSCQASYPMRNGVVDLQPDRMFKRSFAQALMESPAIARIYDGTLWRRSGWQQRALGILFDKESAVIMNAAQIQKASMMLDMACGSGIYTRLFARAMPQGQVVGLDLSMPMLQWAAQKDSREGCTNLAYLRANAHDLPFEDACFDRANSCGAMHLFPDIERVLAEVNRVLKPGGRFTTGTFRKRPGLLGRLRMDTGHSLGVNCFSPQGLEETLKRQGFDDVQLHHDEARWMILSAVKP